MELLAFLISVPGVILVLVLYAWRVQRRRQRLLTAVERHACALCGTPFAEAAFEYYGPVTAAERAAMDRFQQRFARHRVLCHECRALNICTEDGQPFTAVPLREA